MDEAQEVIDNHMRVVASRVIDVFEDVDEETLALDIMPELFEAIGLLEAYGVSAFDTSSGNLGPNAAPRPERNRGSA